VKINAGAVNNVPFSRTRQNIISSVAEPEPKLNFYSEPELRIKASALEPLNFIKDLELEPKSGFAAPQTRSRTKYFRLRTKDGFSFMNLEQHIVRLTF
jgi:hypothetical protein